MPCPRPFPPFLNLSLTRSGRGCRGIYTHVIPAQAGIQAPFSEGEKVGCIVDIKRQLQKEDLLVGEVNAKQCSARKGLFGRTKVIMWQQADL